MTVTHSVGTAASLIVTSVIVLFGASRAVAQNRGVETGGDVSILRLSEFDSTDVGVGAHVIGPLTSALALDGAFMWFPGSRDVRAGALDSQHRVVGLIGLRTIAARGDVEFFARRQVGFLRFGERDRVVCIAIFPAPLECRLAAGYTAFASVLGGGANFGLGPSGRVRVNVEAADLFVRYALQALRPRGEITDGFVSHNPLLSVGLGWRF